MKRSFKKKNNKLTWLATAIIILCHTRNVANSQTKPKKLNK